MKKSSDINNKPISIIIIGSVITILGSVFGVLGISKSKVVFGIVGLLFLVVGLAVLAFGILKFIKLKKYKELYNDPNAYVTEAKFIKAKMSGYSTKSVGVGSIDIPTSINVYKKIIYSYVDETGVEQTVKSVLTYTPNQVEHLQKMGTFKVKCKGKQSAIMEEVPNENKHYNV